MDSLLSHLGNSQTALDLGCGSGSVSYEGAPCRIVGVDLRVPAELPRPARGGFVRADAASLPLAAGCCDLVIANHTLEHIRAWHEVLREVRRVLAPGGTFVVSVPDGYCLSDAVYRFLDKSQEHVNRFRREELVREVEAETGLRLFRSRDLDSSYSFLYRRPGQRFGGRAAALNIVPSGALATGLMFWNRVVAGTRWSVYGWMLWFGPAPAGEPRVDAPEPNVCLRCGSSHSAAFLQASGALRGRFVRRYRCPSCGMTNLFKGTA